MSQQAIEVFAEQIEGSESETASEIKAEYVIGKVDYTKGGLSYATYQRVPRGYRLIVTIRARGTSKNGGYSTESFVMFGGINKGEFIEEAKMFSAKKLEALSKAPAVLVRLQELKAEALAEWKAKHAEEDAAFAEQGAIAGA